MTHVMLDLETWGTRPGSAIRSIGAVVFDWNSPFIGAEFYANIDDESSEAAGLLKDASTVAWWERQSEAAKAALLVDPLPVGHALRAFAVWWEQVAGEFVWSHGANFDQPLLSEAFHACGFPGAPWKFWNSRCTRTLFGLAGFDMKYDGPKRSGTHHNALDDAKHQAICVQRAIAKVSGRAAVQEFTADVLE